MANTGLLGGNVSVHERDRLRDKYIMPLKADAVDFTLSCQCRCGGTLRVKWRGLWYCIQCARWVRRFLHVPDHLKDIV